MDDDGSKSLNNDEFSKALRDYRISNDKNEHRAIFSLFDPNGDGEVSYDEFLKAIVGDMNSKRKALVQRAFKKIDKDGSGVLDISDIKGTYNAKKHPDVMSGKATEDDILYEFLDTFETHYATKHGEQKTRDRSVTLEEFVEYYNNVSCSIDNDDYFETMITNAWNLDNKPAAKKAWAGEY